MDCYWQIPIHPKLNISFSPPHPPPWHLEGYLPIFFKIATFNFLSLLILSTWKDKSSRNNFWPLFKLLPFRSLLGLLLTSKRDCIGGRLFWKKIIKWSTDRLMDGRVLWDAGHVHGVCGLWHVLGHGQLAEQGVGAVVEDRAGVLQRQSLHLLLQVQVGLPDLWDLTIQVP